MFQYIVSERQKNIEVMVSKTEHFIGPNVSQCGVIHKSHDKPTTVKCPEDTLGRFVTLLREENSVDDYSIQICSAVVTGRQGMFSYTKPHRRRFYTWLVL